MKSSKIVFSLLAVGFVTAIIFLSIGTKDSFASHGDNKRARTSDNPISESFGGQEGKTITIMDNDVRRTIECRDNSIKVLGNNCVLTLRGNCNEINVVGNDNVITAESVAAISTLGNDNKVTYEKGAKGKKPLISNTGNGNTISQKKQ